MNVGNAKKIVQFMKVKKSEKVECFSLIQFFGHNFKYLLNEVNRLEFMRQSCITPQEKSGLRGS